MHVFGTSFHMMFYIFSGSRLEMHTLRIFRECHTQSLNGTTYFKASKVVKQLEGVGRLHVP